MRTPACHPHQETVLRAITAMTAPQFQTSSSAFLATTARLVRQILFHAISARLQMEPGIQGRKNVSTAQLAGIVTSVVWHQLPVRVPQG